MRPLLAFLIASAAWAQTRPAPPIPKYEVKRASAPIVVDGKLDDKAWASANTAELTFPWESQTGAKQKTVARLLWDDDNLYVSYDCEDADITAQFTQRDDPTYRDDAVEIFINPRPSQQTTAYIGLEMNARGVLYDYLRVAVGPTSGLFFKRFNLDGVKVAVTVNGTLNERSDKDKGWSLEVSIPWINFEEFSKRPSPGTAWSFNLNRWDGVEPTRRMSIWSDSMQERPGPHAPERFGEMRFVQ
jgi:hypothetical protein